MANGNPTLPSKLPRHPLDPDALQIAPLGGLGEIGMNNMVYMKRDELFLVDCGALFPPQQYLGIDLIVPDMSFLEEHRDKFKGVILTHGHEDHIGGLPFLLPKFPVPVYGTRFTLGLVRSKLMEFDLHNDVDFIEIVPGKSLKFKHFRFDFIRVSHSIADSISVAVRTKEGTVLHTSDFKIDHADNPRNRFDRDSFKRLGDKGVLCLLSDSTNIEEPGFTKGEREVADKLERVIASAEKRVFVATFASSVPRIQTLADLAKDYGRFLHIAGRSMINVVEIAREQGLINIPQSMLIPERDVMTLPPDKVMVLMTGSQGEPRSVLSRVALGEHKYIRVEEGDQVIISARIIPGYERNIGAVVDNLYLQGAEVFTSKNDPIHTSGHAYRGELAEMLELVRPRYFIPIHGEARYMIKHGRLATKLGVKSENVFVLSDGDRVQFCGGRMQLTEPVSQGRLFVDGGLLGGVDEPVLRERRKLGITGMLVAVLIVSQETGELLTRPRIFAAGIMADEMAEEMYDRAIGLIDHLFSDMKKETRQRIPELREAVRLELRRFFHRHLERKPVVVPIIAQM